jgi:hypothetical protein
MFVDSLPCFEGFSSVRKIWIQWMKSHSVEMPLLISFIYLFIYLFICITDMSLLQVGLTGLFAYLGAKSDNNPNNCLVRIY